MATTKLTTNGQLWIGSTAAPHIVVGNITSVDNTITVTNSSGNIDLSATGVGSVSSLTGDDSTAVSPSVGGNIDLLSTIVTSATNPQPIYVRNTVPNTEVIELQVAAASANNNDPTLPGLAYFDNADFSVNALGYVTFTGSGGSQTLTGDDSIAGTPVAGNLNLLSTIVTSATNPQPVYVRNTAGDTETIEVQVSAASANNNDPSLPGLCYFDNTNFSVNALGYVEFTGGAIGQTLLTNVVLTSAQVKNLFTVPITIVPAAGPGTVICVVNAWSKLTYGGTNAFTSGRSIDLKYAGTVNEIITSLCSNAVVTATANTYNYVNNATSFINLSTSIENTDVVASVQISNITGNAANDNTITISVLYYVMTI